VNPKVDAYIARSQKWPAELTEIRSILLACGLTEEIKWGKPTFSHDGANIAILQEMKDFLALMFFKGALMKDPEGVLLEQGPNSRSALRMQFTSVGEVKAMSKTLKVYVKEAIAVEASGAKVAPAPKLALVQELRDRLATDAAFRAAFESLTPGRQREYNLHFSDAKQSATRTARVEKYVPKIMAGKGFRES
jgi:uncharacterized protein YdeI (YjbR/CyaY-like superfamily)